MLMMIQRKCFSRVRRKLMRVPKPKKPIRGVVVDQIIEQPDLRLGGVGEKLNECNNSKDLEQVKTLGGDVEDQIFEQPDVNDVVETSQLPRVSTIYESVVQSFQGLVHEYAESLHQKTLSTGNQSSPSGNGNYSGADKILTLSQHNFVNCPSLLCDFKSCAVGYLNAEVLNGVCLKSCHSNPIDGEPVECASNGSTSMLGLSHQAASNTGNGATPVPNDACNGDLANGEGSYSSIDIHNPSNIDPYEYPPLTTKTRPFVVLLNWAQLLGSVPKDKIKACEIYVIGYFVGRRLDFNYVKRALITASGTKAEFEMKLQNNNLFLFKFHNEEDREKVLEAGSQHITNRLFVIRPWSLHVEKEIGNLSTIPIWIILRKVPEYLWNAEGLGQIASVIGVPICLDRATVDKTRLGCARVCVEISFLSELPYKIPYDVDDEKVANIEVEYAWLPPKCIECGVFGHSTLRCEFKVENTTKKTKEEGTNKKPEWNNTTPVSSMSNMSGVRQQLSGNISPPENSPFSNIDVNVQVKNGVKNGSAIERMHNQEDKLAGRPVLTSVMTKNHWYLQKTRLKDLKYRGHQFTWSNKQQNEDRVFVKLDRALVNEQWEERFPHSETKFLTTAISDHSPIITTLLQNCPSRRKCFKYFQFWEDMEGYKDIVVQGWATVIYGNPMFRFVGKLKATKECLKV
ncbi:hypothetical protein GIB67_023305 [Kingdonia uniflora]|uniref:DUF4283 domain-containing protein n=1 Tax=Kingdonia uniflora TaxID=39325 RepID=A0A7J7KX66_9MAGN|nr:hypothetical protein GIB67_023305 [Kingdonia uniflora]